MVVDVISFIYDRLVGERTVAYQDCVCVKNFLNYQDCVCVKNFVNYQASCTFDNALPIFTMMQCNAEPSIGQPHVYYGFDYPCFRLSIVALCDYVPSLAMGYEIEF